MIKNIVLKECRTFLLTLRFSLGFLVCLALVIPNAYILSQDYAKRIESYQTAVTEHESELSKVTRYSELNGNHQPKAFRKPKLLNTFNQGVAKNIGNKVAAAPGSVPMKLEEYGSDNPYMSVFSSVDLAFIFQVVLSLLALLFAYDTVCGERENGTLSLMLSNAVSKNSVLFGKYLGGMFCLLLPLVVSLTVGLLVIQLSPYSAIKSADWIRLVLFTLVSVLYLSCFFVIGLFISTRTRHSTTSLMFVLFFWTVTTLIFPNVTAFAVDKLSPIKSEEVATTQMDEIWKDFKSEVDSFLEKEGMKNPFEHAKPKSRWSSSGGTAFGYGETISASGFRNEEGLKFAREFYDFKQRLLIRYADKVWDVYRDYLEKNPLRQARLVKNISRISPAYVYYNSTATLSETDLESILRFMSQARQYRREVIQYFENKEAFSSRLWFADDKGKADVDDLPRFSERRQEILVSLKRTLPDVLILFGLNVLFFLGAYASFMRYDVR